MVTEVDIVLAGGGLVGTPLALGLASQGWSVALLDKQSGAVPAYPGVSLDQRCTALSASTSQWLQSRELWEPVSGDAEAIRQVRVTQRGYFGSTCLQAAELGLPALGYVIENREFLSRLQPLLAASDVFCPANAAVQSVDAEETGGITVHYTGADEASVRARLLIAVDGAMSSVRSALGVGNQQVDYHQSAVLGTVALAEPHAGVAHERFTDSGPLALLPRPQQCASVVECINPDQRSAIEVMDDDAYRQHLQDRFGFRLGRFERVGPRLVLPLIRIESSRSAVGRTLFLGNALRLIHPVAGQGYNLALRDVATLLEQLGEVSMGQDPGDPAFLSGFTASRKADRRRVVRLTDALARTFRGSASLPSHLRSLGLLGLDRVTPLRDSFARRSIGSPAVSR